MSPEAELPGVDAWRLAVHRRVWPSARPEIRPRGYLAWPQAASGNRLIGAPAGAHRRNDRGAQIWLVCTQLTQRRAPVVSGIVEFSDRRFVRFESDLWNHVADMCGTWTTAVGLPVVVVVVVVVGVLGHGFGHGLIVVLDLGEVRLHRVRVGVEVLGVGQYPGEEGLR